MYKIKKVVENNLLKNVELLEVEIEGKTIRVFNIINWKDGSTEDVMWEYTKGQKYNKSHIEKMFGIKNAEKIINLI